MDTSTAPAHAALVIDFGNGPGYGHIHAHGCRDARDPEPIGHATSPNHATELANDLTGWDWDDDEYHLAHCARAALKGMAR